MLLVVQALCEANPDIHLNKAYDSQLPSAQRLERHLSPPSYSPAPSFPEVSTKLLSMEKGPCEYCHQLVPLSDIIQHEVLGTGLMHACMIHRLTEYIPLMEFTPLFIGYLFLLTTKAWSCHTSVFSYPDPGD